MLKELTSTKEYLYSTKYRTQTASKHRYMIDTLSHLINRDKDVKFLDVGERNPFSDMVEEEFKIKVYNTSGDLDEGFRFYKQKYDIILISHVIEHIFNPLYMLQRLKPFLKDDGIFIIALPQRTKLLWTKGHYHEIDPYRMRLLLKRAGLITIERIREKVARNWWTYFYGFRPILRLFLEFNSTYIIKKGDSDGR